MRYLLETLNYGLIYRATSSNMQIMDYTDTDFAGCQDIRRSTTGFTFLINGTADMDITTAKHNVTEYHGI